MKVLFAVSNENVSEAIVRKYQKDYKEIISYKNVYYFNAILKELQRDKTYDRIVISEDLEPFSNNNYDQIDKFIFEKLDSISDEATDREGGDTPIILICTDRRTKGEGLLVKLFGIGIYSALIGLDRSIDNVCKLLNKPRTKKEAKIYYKIEAEDVGYQSESEGTVSEVEIQNILNHYRRLGKNEEQYVESFNNIAAQYTDAQLRIIANFLPINVKAVLEVNSPKYQSVMTFGTGAYKTQDAQKQKEKKEEESLKINFIENQSGKPKLTKPVVVPSAVNANNVKKINRKEQESEEEPTNIEKVEKIQPIQEVEEIQTDPPIQQREETILQPKTQEIESEIEPEIEFEEEPEMEFEDSFFEEFEPIEEENQEIEETILEEQKIPNEKNFKKPIVLKRGRGTPKKEVERKIQQPEEKEEEVLNLFDFEDDIIEENIEDDREDNTNKQETEESISLPTLEEIKEETQETIDFEQENEQEIIEEEEIETQEPEEIQTEYLNSIPSYKKEEPIIQEERKEIETRKPQYEEDYSIENLLTRDKKVVSFVGTAKNGTSFIVNNIAKLLSEMGINTAILDMTKNKNSYYIYTKNEEELRNTAFNCMNQLKQGITQGIQINNNLTVYTSLPGEIGAEEHSRPILETLIKNYSLILIDCDFDTPMQYFAKSQEIYLIQSMDILTIQPFTAFLRDLKSENILEQEKLRVVINKEIKVRGLTPKVLLGGMAYYNDPAMSYMTELFDKDKVKYCTIPFETAVYSTYLESLVNCEISFKGYSKTFMNNLKQLGNMVYPLLNNKYKPVNYEKGSKHGNR